LWQAGRELIKILVADLVRQQEERERREHLAQHNRVQYERGKATQEQLQAAQTAHLQAGAEVAALESERARLVRFWHYFKRRAVAHRLIVATQALSSAAQTLSQAQLAAEEIAGQATPEFPGLSLPARRAINIAAIAYAEVLCLRLAPLKPPLVTLARDAIARREASDDYGPPQDCVLLMGHISRAHTLLAARAGVADEIRLRGERLKQVARYRGASDSAPTVDSVAFSEGDILEAGATGSAAARLPNVLAEDTWDLFRILLR